MHRLEKYLADIEPRDLEIEPCDNRAAGASGALIDADLAPEARAGAAAVEASLIESPGRRAVAVFLGRGDYEKVEDACPFLLGTLLLESLPAMVHACGGRIVLGIRFERHGEVLNPVQRTVTLAGRTRVFMTHGYLFIHMPDERVCVSAEPVEMGDGLLLFVNVRSNRSSSAFWAKWRDFARRHNYLRGQAFFADGEIIQRKRKYTWDDLLLPDQTRRLIQTHVEGFLRRREQLKRLGVKPRRGLLLSGPPGTGKTLLGKVLADTVEASFLWVLPRHVRSPGSFEHVLGVARMVAPTVVFLEDLDLFAEEREQNQCARPLGELMNQLDGAADNEDIVTIATTNRLEVIEKALRSRPGRFDRIVKFEVMDEPCRRRFLQRLLAHAALAPDDFDRLLSATEGFTGAQLEELANTLYLLALEQDNPGDPPNRGCAPDAGPTGEKCISVTRALVEAALEEVRVEQRGKLGFRAV